MTVEPFPLASGFAKFVPRSVTDTGVPCCATDETHGLDPVTQIGDDSVGVPGVTANGRELESVAFGFRIVNR
jgi:hypothetical protein